MPARSPCRREPVLAAALAVAAAASIPTAAREPVFLHDERWARAIEEAGVDPGLFENPIAATPAMAAQARELAGEGDDLARLARLQAALFDPRHYTFEYESNRTLTAAEAFESRRGNCVSFVNLFIAMSRTLGIAVRPAILGAVRDVEIAGDLMVINTHLVAAYRRPKGVEIFDFYRSRPTVPVGVSLLDDLDLNAIYLNNLGVERLRAGNLEDSGRHLEAAIALTPRFAEAYANLGVARRRAGDTAGALDAYLGGLAVLPDHRSLRNNLASLFRTLAAERQEEPGAASPGAATPREVMTRADRYLAEGNRTRALELYRRAHRMDPGLVEPLVGIARAGILKGRLQTARRSLLEALELDPHDRSARDLLESLERAMGQSGRG